MVLTVFLYMFNSDAKKRLLSQRRQKLLYGKVYMCDIQSHLIGCIPVQDIRLLGLGNYLVFSVLPHVVRRVKSEDFNTILLASRIHIPVFLMRGTGLGSQKKSRGHHCSANQKAGPKTS